MSKPFVSRLPWVLFAFFLTLAGVGITFQVLRGKVTAEDYMVAASFSLLGACGAFIASRRPENAIGWLLCAIAFFPALGFVGFEYAYYGSETHPGSLPGVAWAGWLTNWAWIIGLGLLGTFLLLLFPTGTLPSRRWRPVAWASGICLALLGVTFSILPGPFDDLPRVRNPLGVEALSVRALEDVGGVFFLIFTGLVLLSAASLVVRFRRSPLDERQQIKWFMFAAVFAAMIVFVGDWLPPPDAVSGVAFALAILGLAGATAVGVLKYRLYDIDVVINKALVYGVLAAFMTMVYVGSVFGLGALVAAEANALLTAAAVAVIAVAFQPVRERARHLANRLVYGTRATPYEVLAQFSERMATTYGAEDVLPRMVRILADGTGAARADVWLAVGRELRPEASWPSGNGTLPEPLQIRDEELPAIPGADLAVPVRDRGELLGALSIAKPKGEPLTPTERKLLIDLASQAGLVLRNVRLISELRASRQRLVRAQDEERRRLERNIHDGAQQQLVALSIKLGLLKQLADKDPGRVVALAEQLQTETRAALEDLRDLARGIYPPLLADQGLAAALEAQGRKSAVSVTVAPDGIGRYPQDVEAAVYFCVLEALQNVAKYANASRVDVRLSAQDGRLEFEVVDDGTGFDATSTQYGTGLQGMADRLAALGGELSVRSERGRGTAVVGALPIRHNMLAGSSRSSELDA